MSTTPPTDGPTDPATEPDADTPTATSDTADTPDTTPGTAAEARPRSTPVAAGAEGAPQPPRRRGIFVDADELRQHVGDLLRAMLGGYKVDAFGNMTFDHEGARVYVTVGPGGFGPQVGVFSITNVELDLSPELATFLLTSNHRMAFGAFSFDAENRAVWLRHSLLGGTLDGPELRGAVLSVAGLAARVAPAISERFGGRRFVDAPAEQQERAHPPEAEDDDVVNASGYL